MEAAPAAGADAQQQTQDICAMILNRADSITVEDGDQTTPESPEVYRSIGEVPNEIDAAMIRTGLSRIVERYPGLEFMIQKLDGGMPVRADGPTNRVELALIKNVARDGARNTELWLGAWKQWPGMQRIYVDEVIEL
jgi:hypothetical protein